MERSTKIKILGTFNSLPEIIRTAICAGYELGKMDNQLEEKPVNKQS